MCNIFIQISRVQQKHIQLLTTTFRCLSESAESQFVSTREHGLKQLTNLVSSPSLSGNDAATASPGVVLMTQYFHSSDEKERNSFVEVLTRNLNEDSVAEIALINEQEFDFSTLPNAEKIKQFVIGRRLTFADAFRVANQYYSGRVVVLSNSDIFFDSTLALLRSASLVNSVLAISRWNFLNEGTINLNLRLDSQDAWAFRAPIAEGVINESVFNLGAPRCDNRLARILSDAGYR